MVEDTPTDKGDKPREKVVIADCGELDPSEEVGKQLVCFFKHRFGVSFTHNTVQIDTSKAVDAHGDAYEEHPSDEEEVRLLTRHILTALFRTVSADLGCTQDVHKPDVSVKIATDLRTIGTTAFKKGDYATALRKCRSSL